MAVDDARDPAPAPTFFFAAQAALKAIGEAVDTVQAPRADARASAGQALAALLLLREVRDELAGWESGLIETARAAGASWADLARPLGVASRQAAERRYLRIRPGAEGSTGEERIQATRDRRAADRAVTAWARGNACDLRQLAGQVTALPDLPPAALAPLVQALGGNDVADLIGPLTGVRDHLAPAHPDLADRIDRLTDRADRLRRDSGEQRRPA